MSRLLDLFSDDIRESGNDLFYDCEVVVKKVKEGKGAHIEARVQEEKRAYVVRVEATARGVSLSCTCKKITSERGCPHMWAALLESMTTKKGEIWLQKRFDSDVIEVFEDIVNPDIDWDDLDDFSASDGARSGLGRSARDSKSSSRSKASPAKAGTSSSKATGGTELGSNSDTSWKARGLSSLHAPPSLPAVAPMGGAGDSSSSRGGSRAASSSRASSPAPNRPPAWKGALHSVETYRAMHSAYRRPSNPVTKPLTVYFLVRPAWFSDMPVELEIIGQRRNKGGWGKRQVIPIQESDLAWIDSDADAAVVRRLTGCRDGRIPDEMGGQSSFLLRADAFAEIAPEIAARGRLLGIPKHMESAGASSTWRNRFGPGDLDLEEAIPLTWDPGDPWRAEIGMDRLESGQAFMAAIRLVRGEARLPVNQIETFSRGFAIHADQLIRIEGEDLRPWIQAFEIPREVHEKDLDAFLESAAILPGCPVIDVPEAKRWKQRVRPPVPRLLVLAPGEIPDMHMPGSARFASPSSRRSGTLGAREIAARLEFDYDGAVIDSRFRENRIVDRENRTIVMRHGIAEAAASRSLGELGVKHRKSEVNDFFVIQESKLPALAQELMQQGWQVRTKDAVVRNFSSVRTRVSSGIDWFAVQVQVSYEGFEDVELARILDAIKRGDRTVRLGDGTVGFVPEDWLRKSGLLLDAGQLRDGELRFGRHQAALLDALLASQPEVSVDETFDRLRHELRSFEGVDPVAPPESFRAELRDYQRDSLGWFAFLRRFGFGGCLADDMGLGKTVMVLALLDSRRGKAGQRAADGQAEGASSRPTVRKARSTTSEEAGDSEARPSLVVVPRSLIFNWRYEAERFAPNLRLLDHSGPDRGELAAALAKTKADVVVTTYGVLRRDIVEFKDTKFDYAILDESQAIKNHWTSTSKAVRLLQARHRLAMSGTPVENHLGELWSLFDFLNPGMLGSAQRFHKWSTAPIERNEDLAAVPDSEVGENGEEGGTRNRSIAAAPGDASNGSDRVGQRATERPVASNLLAAAVRPFVLRRTKAQVAQQLPEKIEQTVFCELGTAQRRLYESLRKHYQSLLLSDGSASASAPPQGGSRSVVILEGLLRLRQAACHSGLIDRKDEAEESAKLDVLVERLAELKEEGHKALVFSQFVKLLELVKPRLESAGIRYVYLDGKTKNRAQCVERFQNEPELDVFLISLKAGGTGLNLTAATYVFLLDPWWNPAVEAQAIDRTHRIGQTRSVLACRLVARDTVEERILELQERKRHLADSIIQADRGLLQNLGREDLELLLS